MGISFWWNHPKRFQFTLACIGQVSKLNLLEKGKLDRITTDSDAYDLISFDPQVVDNSIDCLNHYFVGPIKTHINSKMKMVHDIGTGEGMAGCN